MILETCLAVCINAHFAWPAQDWNLGNWVHGFVEHRTEETLIRPYGSYNQNVTVTVYKTPTVGNCATVIIKTEPFRNNIIGPPPETKLLTINKVCTGPDV